MCSRFFIDTEILSELKQNGIMYSFRREKNTAAAEALPIQSGDIFPSQKSVVLIRREKELYVQPMYWGFVKSYGNGLLINARAETAAEKRSFRDSIQNRRCVIPARHFYEWDCEKNKVTFENPDGSILYIAGCYQYFDEKECFVILTTQANSSVIPVHDRMPLLLEKNELESWLCGTDFSIFLKNKVPQALKMQREFEQQRLFFS